MANSSSRSSSPETHAPQWPMEWFDQHNKLLRSIDFFIGRNLEAAPRCAFLIDYQPKRLVVCMIVDGNPESMSDKRIASLATTIYRAKSREARLPIPTDENMRFYIYFPSVEPRLDYAAELHMPWEPGSRSFTSAIAWEKHRDIPEELRIFALKNGLAEDVMTPAAPKGQLPHLGRKADRKNLG